MKKKKKKRFLANLMCSWWWCWYDGSSCLPSFRYVVVSCPGFNLVVRANGAADNHMLRYHQGPDAAVAEGEGSWGECRQIAIELHKWSFVLILCCVGQTAGFRRYRS